MNSIIEKIYRQVKEMVAEANSDKSNPVRLSCNLAVVIREKVPQKEDENYYLVNLEESEAPERIQEDLAVHSNNEDCNNNVPDEGVISKERISLVPLLSSPSGTSFRDCRLEVQNNDFSPNPKFIMEKLSLPDIPSLPPSVSEEEHYVQPEHEEDLMQYFPDEKLTSIDYPIKKCRRTKDFLDRYEELDMLGEGGFGSVFAGVRRADSKPVAIKHIPNNMVYYSPVKCQDKQYGEVREVLLMAQATGNLCKDGVENPGVIGLIETFELEDEVIIVMEREPEAMDMFAFNKKRPHMVTDEVIQSVFRQLVLACSRMHQNGVFHRDLKMQNTLICMKEGTPEVKVIDFGCGDFVKNQPFPNFCGTLCYAPPEYFINDSYRAEPTTVWQIGAMLRVLYTGGYFDTELFLDGDDAPVEHASDECNDFMSWCLTPNQYRRPSLEELLTHPWLQ